MPLSYQAEVLHLRDDFCDASEIQRGASVDRRDMDPPPIDIDSMDGVSSMPCSAECILTSRSIAVPPPSLRRAGVPAARGAIGSCTISSSVLQRS